MPSLKALRMRINSVKSTQKITSAMKMVAAAKLRRAQTAAEAARPYAERMGRMLASLAASTAGSPTAPRLMAGTGKDQVHLLIVVTADRGLAGAFNSSVGRLARATARRRLAEGKTIRILAVGRKGRDFLRREIAGSTLDEMGVVSRKAVAFADAKAVADRVVSMYASGEFDVCTLIYNRFQSVISQIPTEAQLIPVPVPEPDPNARQATGAQAIYEYEPD